MRENMEAVFSIMDIAAAILIQHGLIPMTIEGLLMVTTKKTWNLSIISWFQKMPEVDCLPG